MLAAGRQKGEGQSHKGSRERWREPQVTCRPQEAPRAHPLHFLLPHQVPQTAKASCPHPCSDPKHSCCFGCLDPGIIC